MAGTKTLVADFGLHSLELRYEPVLNMEYSAVEAYRSQLRINSEKIGVILPAQYLPVAQRTVQASRLSLWALTKVCEDINRLEQRNILLDWISVYVPLRLLLKEDFASQLTAITSAAGVNPSKLCLELPGELLFEDSQIAGAAINALRSFGFKIMICDYASEFCPLMRLDSFACDFVLFDSSVTAKAASEEQKDIEFAANAFAFADSCGAKAIATGVDKNNFTSVNKLCSLSVGKLAGKMKKISSIRS